MKFAVASDLVLVVESSLRYFFLFSLQYIMLVKVRFGESQKYVKVAETEEGFEDYNTFLQKGWYYFFTQP